MSTSSSSPAWKRPGATTTPTLRPWNVTVSAAWTAAPATSPVDAFTPEGTSTETTGSPAALICSICRAVSGRGSSRKPVPKSASTMTSHPVGTSSPDLDDLPTEEPGRDAAVAAVRPLPADRDDASARIVSGDGGRDRAAGAVHQLRSRARIARIRLLRGAHLLRGVERLKHREATPLRSRRRARASASSTARSRLPGRALPTPPSSPTGAPPASADRGSRSPAR